MDARFIIRCPKCRWARMTSGISTELQDLREIKTCNNCGGPRKFRCPKCGQIAKMVRVKGNQE